MENMAATAPPVKQLHNFPLSLKWGDQAQPYRPDPESESDHDLEPQRRPPPRVGSRSARLHRFSLTSCSSADNSNKLPLQSARRTFVAPGKQEPEEDESSSLPWKLRPRKQIAAALGEVKESPAPPPVAAEPKSMRLRAAAAEPSGERGGVILETKKGKRNTIWIARSREEIEEDGFIMTGFRRPRKRPKNVQKLLDCLFPGLWLVGAAADSYRLAEEVNNWAEHKKRTLIYLFLIGGLALMMRWLF